MIGPIELYERALQSEEISDGLQIRFGDGSVAPVPIGRYVGGADGLDHEVLAAVQGPVLDVGCGPGRHLGALAHRGIEALGVDLSPVAVAAARRRGVNAVVANVFGEVPRAGTWASALLLDGNIGIGGQPERLLSRLAVLLAPGGRVLVELEAPGVDTRVVQARVELTHDTSHWFDWGRASVSDIAALALGAEMTVERSWQCGERWFASLRSRSRD